MARVLKSGAAFLIIFLLLQARGICGIDLSLWDEILEDHVHPGRIDGVGLNVVDYGALAKDKRFPFLVEALERFDPAGLRTRSERLSFWINAYNILTVKAVLEHYPVDSIRDIGGLFRSVWSIKGGTIGGRWYSLDEIEHGILRRLDEPRVHFAIVCASLSCPDLRKESYRAGDLDQQLEESTRAFLNNPEKGLKIVESTNTAYISVIFKWFGRDFEKAGGGLKFISRYVSPEASEILSREDLRVRYLDYDWSLNDLARSTNYYRGH